MVCVYVPIPLRFAGKLIPSAFKLFEYDGTHWELSNEANYYTAGAKLDEKAEQVINQEGNREMILKFFENLEKYGIKFEQSQKRMLVASGNTLALGRSGTGKTTVSAYKILAIDLLFKAFTKSVKSGLKNVKLEATDLSLYTGCGIVFCTASPVLTNEVRRFYADLTQKIKEFLINKQKERLRRMQEKAKNEEDKKEDSNSDEEVIDSKEAKMNVSNISLDLTKTFL